MGRHTLVQSTPAEPRNRLYKFQVQIQTRWCTRTPTLCRHIPEASVDDNDMSQYWVRHERATKHAHVQQCPGHIHDQNEAVWYGNTRPEADV